MISNTELVFVFFKEETKLKTSRRIMNLATILEQIGMEVKSPNENENQTPLDILSSPEYKSKYMMINLEHPDFSQIVLKAKEALPNIMIIVTFDKSTVNVVDKLNDVEKTYNIKYNIEKSNLSKETLKNLFIQISQELINNTKGNNRYVFMQKLGGGASAEVELFYDVQLNRKTAVKKIKVEGMQKVEKEKVKLEVENMKSVKVPTAIEFYDFEIENDNRYIYMEYADGGTLESKINSHLRARTTFSTDEIFMYISEIMLALYTLNKRGMMHRDIKSENILLKNEKVDSVEYSIAKLSDLGISRQIDGVVGSLTTCGTPYYVSPEIAAGEKRYDYNADIWSLGVVLYELITLKKPWYDPKISTQELFSLVFNTPYPPLPPDTDPRLKYLIFVMLTKNPKRRADLFDILKINFVHDKVMEILKRFNWNDVPGFQGISEMPVRGCYKTMSIIDDYEVKLIQDAYKIYINCIPHEYKKSFLGSKYTNTRRGEDIIRAFNDFTTIENELKLNNADMKAEDFFAELFKRKILIPLTHTSEDTIEYNIENLFEYSENTLYLFSFDTTNDNPKVDNKPVVLYEEPPEDGYDYMALSQYLLKIGKSMIKALLNNENVDDLFLLNDPRYIRFIHGISYFQHFNLFSLIGSKDKAIAFLLNLYQIMFIHHIFKNILNITNTKSGLFSYFKNDISIIYNFQDATLNNLEIKHVIFRNNKVPPGNYMRLAYSNDRKTQILPNFSDLRPLLILYEFKYVERPNFKIFEEKAIDEQLNELVFQAINWHIQLSSDQLCLPSFIQPYVTDFAPKDKEEFPEGLLKFLLSFFNVHKEYTASKPYKLVLNLNDRKKFDSFNSSLIRDIHNNRVKIVYT